MLTTDQKGALAETAIAHAAIKLGIGVYKPLSDGERYDLIFGVKDELPIRRARPARAQAGPRQEQPASRYQLAEDFAFDATLGALLGP